MKILNAQFVIENIKYCYQHNPSVDEYEIKLKKLCKYCDLCEKSDYICKTCEGIKNKKETSIIRYLRKHIDTKFEYNNSSMLGGCSKKRPDAFFELQRHCIDVEIDEHQHNAYEDRCECARLNEIVNGIGGKSVIVIRYNPDKVYNNRKLVEISQENRLNLLVKVIRNELIADYDKFQVKLIQLYYNDNYAKYQEIKEEDITSLVCI